MTTAFVFGLDHLKISLKASKGSDIGQIQMCPKYFPDTLMNLDKFFQSSNED